MKLKLTSLTLILLGCLGLFYNESKAQSSQKNTIQFSSDEQVWLEGSAINNGNRIVSVGSFINSGYVQKTSQRFSGTDSFDSFIICTDESGNIIWKKIFGSQYNSWCMNVACDNSGNSYVSGYFEKSFVLDGITFSSPGNFNDFLMKLDSNGKVIWGISYAVPYSYYQNNSTTPMRCDAGGNLYYTLSFINSVKINNQTFSNSSGGSRMLIKFDNSGNLIWGKTMQGRGNFSALTTDIFGHVYIGGDIGKGITTWGGANLPGATDTASVGLFISKLDANTGDMLWMERCTGTTSYSELTYLNIGINGTIYAGGYFGDTLTIGGQNYYATSHMYNGYQDGLVMNFDTSGKVIWLQHYGNTIEPEYPAGFCMDQSDNVYIGGTYDAPITLGSKTLFSTVTRDSYIIRFDRYGNYKQSISTKGLTYPSFTIIDGLMTDNHSRLFMYGSFVNQTNLGADTLSSPGPSSGFIWEIAPSFTAGIAIDIQKSVNGFRLYPNPSNGNILNIEIDNGIPKGNAEISCSDATGRLVFSKSINQSDFADNTLQFHLPEMQPGLYFISLISRQGISVQKLVRN
jgi:hypothetical protein